MSFNLEPLDKANIQTLVDGVGDRSARFERSQNKLDKALNQFTEFFIQETPEDQEIPYQFDRKNILQFKTPISEINKSMWVFSYVVKNAKMELHQREIPPPALSTLPMAQGGKLSELKGMLDSFRNFSKKYTKDPDSPYNSHRDEFQYLMEIPHQYTNMLHIYYLSVVHRPKINTRLELDRVKDDIWVFFNAHLEPNLQARKDEAVNIMIDKTNDKIAEILVAYKELAERHEKMYMMGGGMSPMTPN